MKPTTLAAATFALSGALFFNPDAAQAKGPLGVEGQSQAIFVKETPTTLELADFPWGLEEGRTENVRLVFEQEVPGPESDEPMVVSYALTMPWIDVEKDGDDKITLTMDEQLLTMSFVADTDTPLEFNMDMLYDGLTATFERDGERMVFAATADGMTMEMSSPQAEEEGVDFTYKLAGKGLSIEGEGAAEQNFADIRALDISYDYTLDSMTMDIAAGGEGMGGEEFNMVGEFGETTSSALIRDGRMETDAVVNGIDFEMTAPMPIAFSAEKMAMAVGMPTEPSPKPQDIKYLIDLQNIELSDEIWGMADPTEAFPRNLARAVIDLDMQAMMMVSIFDPEAMAEAEASGMPPMIPTGVTINSIAFDGLGLKVDAKGEGALKGTTPEGEAYVTVKGLSDFVASAMKAGMFGEQEAMMVEGMAGQLGKEGDDGELIFDIKTDGAMLNINGAPVMPIPGMQ